MAETSAEWAQRAIEELHGTSVRKDGLLGVQAASARAQACATISVALAFQEAAPVKAEIVDPPQLGWIDRRVPLDSVEPWRRVHTHTPDEQRSHTDCVPVWVDA
jgi:hypothetical protein